MNFINIVRATGLIALSLISLGATQVETPEEPQVAMCLLPQKPAGEYLCKHCNCIMVVNDGEWEQECAACNCGKANHECLR